jgi:preprotein translocase subunit SecG
MAWLWMFLLKFMMVATASIVIILVLLQKGKGGGLAGALGGMGGQSAFGTKAGDLFTKITIGVAAVWILTCVVAAMAARHLADEQITITPSTPQQQSQGQPPPSAGDKPAGAGGAASSPPSGSVPEPPSNPTEKPAK